MFNMDNKVLKFVEWLPTHSDVFKGMSVAETVSKLNSLVKSVDGKDQIAKLTKYYNETEILRRGGKLDYLVQRNKWNK